MLSSISLYLNLLFFYLVYENILQLVLFFHFFFAFDGGNFLFSDSMTLIAIHIHTSCCIDLTLQKFSQYLFNFVTRVCSLFSIIFSFNSFSDLFTMLIGFHSWIILTLIFCIIQMLIVLYNLFRFLSLNLYLRFLTKCWLQ